MLFFISKMYIGRCGNKTGYKTSNKVGVGWNFSVSTMGKKRLHSYFELRIYNDSPVALFLLWYFS